LSTGACACVRMYVRLSVCASICMNIRNVQTWMHAGRICTWIHTVIYIHAHTRTVRANTARPNMHSQADSVPECVPSERREIGPSARKEHLFPPAKRRRLHKVKSVHQVGGRCHRSHLESLLSLRHERPQSEPQEARYAQRRRRRLGAARAHTWA
jgi:hypothetical protein